MKQVTKEWLDFNINALKQINEIYLTSRYPGHLGLMADGKPTIKEAKSFYKTATEIYDNIKGELELKR